MITIFNRTELTVTYSMSEQTEIREALAGEGIPYRVRTERPAAGRRRERQRDGGVHFLCPPGGLRAGPVRDWTKCNSISGTARTHMSPGGFSFRRGRGAAGMRRCIPLGRRGLEEI